MDRDLDGNNAWGMRLQIGARFGQHFQHFAQNEQAGFMCLRQGFFHHIGAQTADFDVHLQGGDAFFRTGDLEIHIAQVVFCTLDVGQDLVTAGGIGDEAHGHTGYRGLDRHASIHQRQG